MISQLIEFLIWLITGVAGLSVFETSQKESLLFSNLCDLLCFMIRNHKIHIKFLIVVNHVTKKLVPLLKSKESWLKLGKAEKWRLSPCMHFYWPGVRLVESRSVEFLFTHSRSLPLAHSSPPIFLSFYSCSSRFSIGCWNEGLSLGKATSFGSNLWTHCGSIPWSQTQV